MGQSSSREGTGVAVPVLQVALYALTLKYAVRLLCDLCPKRRPARNVEGHRTPAGAPRDPPRSGKLGCIGYMNKEVSYMIWSASDP